MTTKNIRDGPPLGSILEFDKTDQLSIMTYDCQYLYLGITTIFDYPLTMTIS